MRSIFSLCSKQQQPFHTNAFNPFIHSILTQDVLPATDFALANALSVSGLLESTPLPPKKQPPTIPSPTISSSSKSERSMSVKKRMGAKRHCMDCPHAFPPQNVQSTAVEWTNGLVDRVRPDPINQKLTAQHRSVGASTRTILRQFPLTATIVDVVCLHISTSIAGHLENW